METHDRAAFDRAQGDADASFVDAAGATTADLILSAVMLPIVKSRPALIEPASSSKASRPAFIEHHAVLSLRPGRVQRRLAGMIANREHDTFRLDFAQVVQ